MQTPYAFLTECIQHNNGRRNQIPYTSFIFRRIRHLDWDHPGSYQPIGSQ